VTLSTGPDSAAAWQLTTPAQRRAVTRRIDEVLLSLAGPLVPTARRMLRAQSKMLRPGLCLAVAALGGEPDRAATSAAATVELLHCAALVHDDLLDGADERRNVPAVSALEGPATAVITGDFLIAAAQTAALDVGPAAVADSVSALGSLCIGQAREEQLRWDMTTTVADALEVARGKTGSLLRLACLLGARAGRLPGELLPALSEFGTDFGLALQAIDDVLDLASSPELLGKPVGSDLRSGVMSVPIAMALHREPELCALLTPAATPADISRATDLVHRCGAVADTIRMARAHAERAATSLDAAGMPLSAGFVDWPRRYVDTLLDSMLDERYRADLNDPVDY
jgi:octaprenyl-diphosphate synthase